MWVGSKLIVFGNASATATNILANEMLFQSATAAMLVSGAFYLGVTLLIYELLKPVNRTVSLLAAFFSLVGCAGGGLWVVSSISLRLSS